MLSSPSRDRHLFKPVFSSFLLTPPQPSTHPISASPPLSLPLAWLAIHPFRYLTTTTSRKPSIAPLFFVATTRSHGFALPNSDPNPDSSFRQRESSFFFSQSSPLKETRALFPPFFFSYGRRHDRRSLCSPIPPFQTSLLEDSHGLASPFHLSPLCSVMLSTLG